MKTDVYVLCGGKSVEHEVSLKSATAIINALDRKKFNVYPIYITKDGAWCNLGKWDNKIENPEDLQRETDKSVANSIGEFFAKDFKGGENLVFIPALHGPNGEDGTIQGLLELLDVPYVGNKVLSSAVAMDKVVARDLFQQHNLPQAKYLAFKSHQWKENKENAYDKVEKHLGFPCYVKPANSGSSVGISIARNRKELEESFKMAFQYDLKIIVEEEVIAREMQTSVIGNNNPKASISGEFIMERPFFDYNAKYIDGTIVPVVPARLEPEVATKVRELAVEAFKVLNCNGLARVDIFVTDNNEVLINEVNTMPGFTLFSMTPVLWEATNGTTYSELIEWLIELAFERYEEEKSISSRRILE
ncbi:MAG: D-alanine--D-alanine ligase [Tissierellia bacterium]|nr:D-alanine--D-alanine ligase [Tissierellia bacterium]